MSVVVDARGLACPQPVIQTRKAMEQAEELTTLVNSETSMTNVTRMAEKAGWQAIVVREGDDFVIGLTKGAPAAEALPQVVGRAEAADGPAVLVVSGEIMGRGSAELGDILVRGFFHTLAEVEPRPQVAILFNAGVKLACEGSPLLDDLRALESEALSRQADPGGNRPDEAGLPLGGAPPLVAGHQSRSGWPAAREPAALVLSPVWNGRYAGA